mgnify:CR=1 FL=1|jgi:acyl carrier protein
MEEKVIALLEEVLDVEGLDSTCSQTSCEEWDSMAQLNIVAELEDVFDVSLEPEEIASMKSFDEIIKILKSKGVE